MKGRQEPGNRSKMKGLKFWRKKHIWLPIHKKCRVLFTLEFPCKGRPYVVLCPIYSCGAFDAHKGIWCLGGRQIDLIIILTQFNITRICLCYRIWDCRKRMNPAILRWQVYNHTPWIPFGVFTCNFLHIDIWYLRTTQLWFHPASYCIKAQ